MSSFVSAPWRKDNSDEHEYEHEVDHCVVRCRSSCKTRLQRSESHQDILHSTFLLLQATGAKKKQYLASHMTMLSAPCCGAPFQDRCSTPESSANMCMSYTDLRVAHEEVVDPEDGTKVDIEFPPE